MEMATQELWTLDVSSMLAFYLTFWQRFEVFYQRKLPQTRTHRMMALFGGDGGHFTSSGNLQPQQAESPLKIF